MAEIRRAATDQNMTGYFVAIVVAIHLTLGAHAISGSVHSLRRSIDRASHEIVNFGRMVKRIEYSSGR